MKGIITPIALLLAFSSSGQNTIIHYEEFNLFKLVGISKIPKNICLKKDAFTAIVLNKDSIIIEILFRFPKVKKQKPIVVKLHNFRELDNKVFVADTSMFFPAYTGAYKYKNYFRDTLYRIDSNRILLRSVLAINSEIGSETYKLLYKSRDTIFVRNLYESVNLDECIIVYNGKCFDNSYKLANTSQLIKDSYCEKWFIRNGQVIKKVFKENVQEEEQKYMLISNSLFYSFLYRGLIFEHSR